MKLSKYSKSLSYTAIVSATALFALVSTNSYAGQYPHYGYKGYGYDRYYQPPAPPGYIYYQPDMYHSKQGSRYIMDAAGTSSDDESAAPSSRVDITAMQFQPAAIRVKAGETVTWVNQEAMPHTITSSSGDLLASDRLGRGGSYAHTFTDPGTYTYYCSLHPSMIGEVIVE